MAHETLLLVVLLLVVYNEGNKRPFSFFAILYTFIFIVFFAVCAYNNVIRECHVTFKRFNRVINWGEINFLL